MVNIIRTEIRQAWADSGPLTATSLLMVAALVIFSAGLLLDPRTIGGAPAWLKPAKFAISTAIFSATVAWLFRYITVWRPFVRALGGIICAVILVEVAIIALQAARGTSSHFNVATPFDRAMFTIMGIAIGILWTASIGVFAALVRQRFDNPAWGWWLRLGMLITVLGSAAGGLMLRTTPEQNPADNVGRLLGVNGAHTVGAPDGGPGLPVTNWSTRHGDLRIPHFFGLHGIQILPFLGWLTARRDRAGAVRAGLAFVAAASYTSLTGILTWQALRGQSIIAPDATTLAALALWACASAAAVVLARGASHLHRAAAAARA